MPKKAMSVEESEVATALTLLRRGSNANADPPAAAPPAAPAFVDQPGPSHVVKLQDGSDLDLRALVNASITNFLAHKSAKLLMEGTRVGPGTSSHKRTLDSSTHMEMGKKRFCHNREMTEDDPSQGYSQDEDESDESSSGEEEEPFGFSSVFGVGINDATINTGVG